MILLYSKTGLSRNNKYRTKIKFLINDLFSKCDGGRYHIETSPLICRANQWTGFYMISASVTFTGKIVSGKLHLSAQLHLPLFLWF